MKAILVLAFILVSCHGWKLNVPRVLLPLADEGAKFLVYSEGGCFSWTSTRPEVVKANPTQNPNTEEKTGDLLEITQEGLLHICQDLVWFQSILGSIFDVNWSKLASKSFKSFASERKVY